MKSKSLRVVTVNFQSAYNKKDELSSFVIENDVDIVLGSKIQSITPKFSPQCTLL